MEDSEAARLIAIFEALDSVVEALPPEIRLQIDSVNSGQIVIGVDEKHQQEILVAVDRMVAHFEGNMVSNSNDARMKVAFSWWSAVNQQAKAIRHLTSEGLNIECTPNVRSAFEYAMALVTISRQDPIETLVGLISNLVTDVVGFQNNGEQSLANFQGVVEDAQSVIGSAVVDKWIRGFTKRSSNLPVDFRVNFYYRIMSMFVHPTLLGVMAFPDQNVDPSTAKISKSVAEMMVGNPLLWALQCQCWSALAVDQMIEGGLRWKSELNEIILNFEIPFSDSLFRSETNG
jgi:hypothetical protein